MSNFKFLAKINKDLYYLGYTAEKLFRDEYFEQCIAQTRKMAEAMTKEVLGSKACSDDTFDDMIYKLKTISGSNLKEQEFISDMYFLKKHGNIAVHSAKTENSGKIALECLEHAFEASVNFASNKTKDEMINMLLFDEKLLVLGEKNNNLQTQYLNKIKENKEKQNPLTKKRKKINAGCLNTGNKKSFKQNNSEKLCLFSNIIKIVIVFCITVFIALFMLSKYTKQNISKTDNFSKEKIYIENKTSKSEITYESNNKKTAKEYTLSGNFSNKI